MNFVCSVATLLENPLPIYAVGAVLATVSGLAFLARRSLPSLFALIGVVVLTLLLVIVERVVVTEREQVESALQQLMADVEAGDMLAVLARIDSGAVQMRGDVEKLMPQAEIKDTGATAVRVEVDADAEPMTATSQFRGKIDGVHRRSGMRVFFFDEVEIRWVKRGDVWLAEAYAVKIKGKAIDPVSSMRSKRPASK